MKISIRSFAPISIVFFSVLPLFSEGTQTWQQTKFEDFEKGTAKGVSLRSDGVLELAPALKAIHTSPATYIWALAADKLGNAYLATGSPARVYRVTPDGKASVIFESTELQVQALRGAPDGSFYAATSPDGKVYKIERTNPETGKGPPEKAKKSSTAANATENDGVAQQTPPKLDPGFKSSVYYDPKSKYIWNLAVAPNGKLYVATGDRGEIFQVEPNGQGSLFFKSDEAHIRVLSLDNRENVIAGSDGSGLIYRITPQGEGFVLYSAAKKEITSLVIDHKNNIFASAVGDKRASTVSASPTFAQPPVSGGGGGSGGGAANPTPQPAIIFGPPAAPTGGSEIYMIAADGSPKRIWSSRDDIVYALAVDRQGKLLAGSGNKGRIYAIANPEHASEYAVLLKVSANQLTDFASGPDGALYASTSNLGKLFQIGPKNETVGTFESDVFDARSFTRWGRAEVRGSGDYDIFARSGNVDNPDRNWSPWKKIDLRSHARLDIPSARFVQWKAVLHPGPPPSSIESVIINYLPRNVAPVVDDIAVQVGARFQTAAATRPANETVMVGLSNSSNTPGFQQTRTEGPMAATKDRDYIAVRWAAHDDNEDELIYSLYYRGDGESRWKLLKDNIKEKFYSWDAGLLPDGGYTVKVVASDLPSHFPDEALSDEKISAHFEVDTTPPRIDSLLAKLENGELHVTFRATDSFSPINRAEYSIDAGEWQFLEPVGQLSDSLTENYDFNVLLKQPVTTAHAQNSAKSKNGKRRGDAESADSPVEQPTTTASEHVVVVRVYDRYDNAATAKTVVRP